MAKSMIRIFWLLIGLAGIGFGGYSLYQKQYFPVSHASFVPENSAQIYIPDLLSLIKKENGLAVVESYAGDKWVYVLGKIKKDLKGIVSSKICQSDAVNTISFQGLPITILEELSNDAIPKQQNTIEINGERVFFWQNNQLLVLSDAPILPKSEKVTESKLRGNADFFFKGEDGVLESVKLTDKVKFSSYLTDDVLVKGKALSAQKILSICPLAATVAKYYGSTRFLDDISALQSQDTVSHLSWVDNELLYIQKDSFEILAGIQNDGIQLKNIILEGIVDNLGDTAINESIYFNNTEIIPFDLDWNWQEMCVDVKKEFHYFASYNDFVFISNDLQAMYWLLKNIQLGKTYEAFQLTSKIPARVNTLMLEKTDYGTAISSKTWIDKQRSVNLAAMSSRAVQSNDNQLIAEFSHVDNCEYLLLTEKSENQRVISFSGETIQAYNLEGEKEWEYEASSTINLQPKLVLSPGKKETWIAFAEGKNITILTDSGKVIQTIDKVFSENIKELQVTKMKSDTFLVARTLKKVAVFNALNNSKLMEISSDYGISSVVVEPSGSSHILSVFYENDSIECFDFKFKSKIATTSKANLTGNLLPVIQGNFLTKQNLRLVSYENDYLKIKYFNNSSADSILLNSELKPDKIQWINFKGTWLLAFEYFDRLIIYNKLGLVELEMAKPEVNLSFVPFNFTIDGVFAFNNIVDKKWYFTDRYGNLLVNNPIDSDGRTFSIKPYLLNKTQNRIHIYKLNY